MAIEDALTRLARAIELQGEASAVAELIRQRDQARDDAARHDRDKDWYERMYKDYSAKLREERHRTAALRGVITRMKRKAGA